MHRRRVLDLDSKPSVRRQRLGRPAWFLTERRQSDAGRLEQTRRLDVDRVRDSNDASH